LLIEVSYRLAWSVSGDERETNTGVRVQTALKAEVPACPTNRRSRRRRRIIRRRRRRRRRRRIIRICTNHLTVLI
jgi:hypothetical protein